MLYLMEQTGKQTKKRKKKLQPERRVIMDYTARKIKKRVSPKKRVSNLKIKYINIY